MDFVLTVYDNAAAKVCPIWPGHPMKVHMEIPDPAAVSGTEDEIGNASTIAYRRLRERISMFVSLPLQDLDKPTLQSQLNKISESG